MSKATVLSVMVAVLAVVVVAFFSRLPSLSTTTVRTSSRLLASKEFVRDMARLSEQMIMYDVGEHCFNTSSPEALQPQLASRERAPFDIGDPTGDVLAKPEAEAASCPVRLQRALWWFAFRNDYEIVEREWIDTARGLEKQALVMLLRPRAGGPPLITVSFRGSKTLQDYIRTDASLFFFPVPGDEADSPTPAARWMPLLRSSALPCVSFGAWQAYAGRPGAQPLAHADAAPRVRVRALVERLLTREPEAKLVLSGHSLGGALATLCAFDLLAHSPAVRIAGTTVTLLTFASPRFFNGAFRAGMRVHEAAGRLHALRVVVGADLVPRLLPRFLLGCVHGVRDRVTLRPDADGTPRAYFTSEDPDDAELWRIPPGNVHNHHAIYLGGDRAEGSRIPLPSAALSWPIFLEPS